MKQNMYCGNCGQLITDWEDVEFTGEELILTHNCECGRYAELKHRIVFDSIKVIEEGEAANVR